MIDQVDIEGSGVAAVCCARLLALHGQRMSIRQEKSLGGQVLLVNSSTQALLTDLFGDPSSLFAGFPVIEKRIVKWGSANEPKVFAHNGIVIRESELLERLHCRVDGRTPSSSEVADWRILSTSQALPADQKHFGSRRAVSIPVHCHASTSPDACFIEAVETGWLFLLPCGERTGSLLAIGANAEELLGQSSVVADQIDEFSGVPREFPAYPRISYPMFGDRWLACGSGATSFDPICGEGVGHSVREAILASAVVRYIAEERSAAQALNHYSSRLLAGFLRHLQISAEYYSASLGGIWWDSELAQIKSGIEWTQNCLASLPALRCRLLGFTLECSF